MRPEDALTATILGVIQQTCNTAGNVTMIRLATAIATELREGGVA